MKAYPPIGDYLDLGLPLRRARVEGRLDRLVHVPPLGGAVLDVWREPDGYRGDPRRAAPVGNFPQAFSHLGLIQAALALGDTTSG